MRSLLFPLLLLPLSNSAFSATCNADSYPTLSACLVSGNTVTLSADIVLQPEQQIGIIDMADVVIDGKGHTISETPQAYLAPGLVNAFMIRIQRARGVEIRDLRLRSPSARHAECRNEGIHYLKAPCAGAIAVINSSAVTMSGLDIDMEKTFLLQISGSTGVSVAKSEFRNAATYGIWTSRHQSKRIDVASSYFEHVGANAIMLNNVHSATISGNHFYDNHWDRQYSGFGGGQVALEDVGEYLEEINIVDNLIQGGSQEYAMGIEFAHFDDAAWVSGQIRGNRIEGHRASAIKLNIRDARSDLRQLTIEDNQLIDNFIYQGSQIEVNGHAFVDINSNPQTNDRITRTGTFRGTQKVCHLDEQSQCSVQVRWSSSGLVDPRVYVRSSSFGGSRYLVAANASGVVSFPWVDGSGGVFELVEGDSPQPIAAVTVIAEP